MSPVISASPVVIQYRRSCLDAWIFPEIVGSPAFAKQLCVELKKRNISTIKFLLIGDGSEKTRLQKLATQEQLDCVIFHPPISKLALAQITAQLDCGLMFLDNIPAFYYGTSPNKFFDYISAGIPVINNYPGWLAGMITENQCGVAIPPKDTQALVNTLIALSREPSSCMKMGESARMLAEKEFSREKLANQFCDFIEHQSRLSA